MLTLKNIVKTYAAGGETVLALDGISMDFRRNEFVSILGPSGCGKTTLLNIIGGLDRYDSGDLVIDGKSTKDFRDGDWDTYRNHSIGFVFQSYNLIPHQSVLANVELALTLSGVSKRERRERAKKALERVGLGDQLRKKPSQMSGGQMQRVAIARALVNEPEILLADEPTGALDTATSVQIMDILKEIAKDRLVIMVTHNPDLAETYSTRIIRMLDGKIQGDSDPYLAETEQRATPGKKQKRARRPSMSFFTALSLSFKNLLTKKGRTFMTAFAGSIGIIGIALILSLSNGIQNYIDRVQEDTLSTYPISLQASEVDMSGLLTTLTNSGSGTTHEKDAVYSSPALYEMMNAMLTADTRENNLAAFKLWLEQNEEELGELVSAIEYSYDVGIETFAKDKNGDYLSTDVMSLFDELYASAGFAGAPAMMTTMPLTVWDELLPDKDGEGVHELIHSQYDLIYGKMPERFDEIVIIVNQNNEVTDLTLFTLGLKDRDDMGKIMSAAVLGEPIEAVAERFPYEELCARTLKLILPTDYFKKNAESGLFEDIRGDQKTMNIVASGGVDLKVVGILRPSEDATSATLTGSIGYTKALTEYILDGIAKSEVIKAQKAPENENFDVLSGLPFTLTGELDLPEAEKPAAFLEYVKNADNATKSALYEAILSSPPADYLKNTVDSYMAQFPTREEQEALVAENFAGVDSELLASYLEAMSDEELREALRSSIQSLVETEYAESIQKQLTEIVETPSDEELAALKGQVLASLPDKMTQVGFIAKTYSERTALPMETVAAYLMSLKDAEFAAILEELVTEQAMDSYRRYILPTITEEQRNGKLAVALEAYCATLDDAALRVLYDSYMPATVSSSTLAENLKLFGDANLASPATINIYPIDFNAKELLADKITAYNETVSEEDAITYTDYVGIMMSSVSIIIDVISYVLIAFVAISLVVSSIMIGIITYISVLERTKEIGILRAIGASKRDISRVFNAETFIVGLAAGVIGIGSTLILCLPVNAIIRHLSGIQNIGAELPAVGGIILVLISILLTMIAGLIPSRVAAKKDPVVSLRSE